MSLDGTYDDANIFALILQGKIPSTALYEDADTLSFLDIMPQTRGHALVISKWSKARNLLEMEDKALAQVMATTKKVATAIRKALNNLQGMLEKTTAFPDGELWILASNLWFQEVLAMKLVIDVSANLAKLRNQVSPTSDTVDM